ncbi:SDR family oxidoreductase [Zoogloea sp.]|uniref:SDR family oxidoreductase n=1 Tax=Zoogloea sp. TaxID=49181 RepID=UPI002C2F93F7|nr:SDR family oxidoreductase [Zoogloea sp.]
MSAVVLVSGATSGMGLETTLCLARQGYRVFAGYRNDAGRRTLEDHAHELGDRIIPVPLDVQESISVDRAVASVLRTAGRLDVLVNNAGYGLVASVEDGTDEEFIRQFDVNVFGVLRLCRAAIPAMRRSGGGVIVNVGSFLGHMGLPLLTHYNASKYAVEGITDSLRIELRDFGIRVHTVAPGLFRTDFVRRGLAANSSTTAAGSAYAVLADQLLPAVAQRINEGPDPAGVAEAILQVITNPASPARVPVGEEAVLGETWKRSLDPAAFERQVQAFFGLAG